MRENTGKTKYVLLGLMEREPQTGYTIKKAIEYEYSHFWQESYGQIYPTLKTLVKEGLAESVKEEPNNKRGQITYRITAAGKEELKKWLSEEPSIEKIRYEILLKVSFGASTESETILRQLEDFIRRNEKSIQQIDKALDYLKKENQWEGRMDSEITALCGKYFYTAMKDWALEAKKMIVNKKEKK
jgi:DNA-binding PadR family transcriptional regulator